MKTKLIVTLVALASLAIVSISCSTVAGWVTTSRIDWSFIQTVGGIRVGDPQPLSKGNWIIPIECDVSGLTTVTVKPTTVNSALVVKDIRCKTRRDTILVWAVACVVTERYRESHWTQGISVKGTKPGKYTVQYLNPDGTTVDIRSIELRE